MTKTIFSKADRLAIVGAEIKGIIPRINRACEKKRAGVEGALPRLMRSREKRVSVFR